MEISDGELFDSALSNEQPEVVEQPVQVTEGEGDTQARDEQGRFAKSEQAEQPKPEVEQAKPVEQKEAAESPGVRQLREALERSNRRAEELERRFVATQPKPEPPPKPDFYENPDGAIRAGAAEVVSPFEQRLSTTVEAWSKKFAIKEHGEEALTEAFSTLDQAAKAGDPQALAVVQSVKQSTDPYGDIVAWHRANEASRNPDGFFQRRLEEALKDEKFRGELAAKLNPTAEKPKPVVQLPPSLSRAASAASSLSEGGDLSNESLFAAAMR